MALQALPTESLAQRATECPYALNPQAFTMGADLLTSEHGPRNSVRQIFWIDE